MSPISRIIDRALGWARNFISVGHTLRLVGCIGLAVAAGVVAWPSLAQTDDGRGGRGAQPQLQQQGLER